MSSTVSSVIYYEKMEINNDLKGDIEMEPINYSYLLYAILVEQANQVSTAADPNNNTLDQHVPIDGPALNTFNTASSPCIDEDNIINIQLPYNPNKSIEFKLWDGNFHPISLYRSLEHLTSDVENIKKSMAHITIYIKNNIIR